MAKALRRTLEKRVGFEECEFTIPHVFLPPRFKDQSRNRNMILALDTDCVAHVRWENSRVDPHHPLTPGEVKRLMKDVFRKMSQYRRDLNVFSTFLNRNSEVPFWDPREHSLTPEREERDAPLEEEVPDVEPSKKAIAARVELETAELGGETPPYLFTW